MLFFGLVGSLCVLFVGFCVFVMFVCVIIVFMLGGLMLFVRFIVMCFI